MPAKCTDSCGSFTNYFVFHLVSRASLTPLMKQAVWASYTKYLILDLKTTSSSVQSGLRQTLMLFVFLIVTPAVKNGSLCQKADEAERINTFML